MTIPALSRAERKVSQRAMLHARLPDLPALTAALATVFGEHRPLKVVRREPNEYASSFPSEVVTLRLDGRVLRILCKYEAGQEHAAHGHRADVAYEAKVYRHILEPLGLSTAGWFGGSDHSPTGDSWLVIEYVAGAVGVADTPDSLGAVTLAARWIGNFHATTAGRVDGATAGFLRRYDAGYYRDWARRTTTFAAGMRARFPWLPTLCLGFGRSIDLLLANPTIIHGEYGPKNVLVCGDRVCPVDWESAAIGAGEVDLAALTDGRWLPEIVAECEREYTSARWPNGSPTESRPALDLARMYWNFRWLGERSEWTVSAKGLQRLESLRLLAERLELI